VNKSLYLKEPSRSIKGRTNKKIIVKSKYRVNRNQIFICHPNFLRSTGLVLSLTYAPYKMDNAIALCRLQNGITTGLTNLAGLI